MCMTAKLWKRIYQRILNVFYRVNWSMRRFAVGFWQELIHSIEDDVRTSFSLHGVLPDNTPLPQGTANETEEDTRDNTRSDQVWTLQHLKGQWKWLVKYKENVVMSSNCAHAHDLHTVQIKSSEVNHHLTSCYGKELGNTYFTIQQYNYFFY